MPQYAFSPYPYFLNALSGTRTQIPDHAFLLALIEEAKRKLEEASSNFTALFLYFCWLQ